MQPVLEVIWGGAPRNESKFVVVYIENGSEAETERLDVNTSIALLGAFFE